MYKKTVTYTDFNGIERTEDHYFNLTEMEILELQTSMPGGLQVELQRIIATNNASELIKFFRDFVIKCYGAKSADGRSFDKSEEVVKAFTYTAAFHKIYRELAFDDKAAAEFINGVVPANLKEQLDAAGEAPQIAMTK